MSRVLVTGGAGFLGSRVAWFLGQSSEVIVVRSAEHDLRHKHVVRQLLKDVRPDIVVHCAATVGGISANIEHPGRFLYENTLMGMVMMEQSRLLGVKKFVTIGTACEYPDDAWVPLREETLWDGYPAEATAPYGIAKRLLLVQGQAYRAEYGFNAIHVIPTNLYGPGDHFGVGSHVLAALVARFSEAVRTGGEEVPVWGSGWVTRDFLYVDDAATGIGLATWHYDDPEPVNLGTGVETTIGELAQTIAEVYGYKGLITWARDQPEGTRRRVMDITRAKAFGFRAFTELDDGIKRTVEWFEENRDHALRPNAW